MLVAAMIEVDAWEREASMLVFETHLSAKRAPKNAGAAFRPRATPGLGDGGEGEEVGVEVACCFWPPPLFSFFLRLGPVSFIRMPGR